MTFLCDNFAFLQCFHFHHGPPPFISLRKHARPLTFETLILSHHPFKDHSDDLSDGGSGCIVGDVVLGEVQTETQHNGLGRGQNIKVLCSIYYIV